MDTDVVILEGDGGAPAARRIGANGVDDLVYGRGRVVAERFAYNGHPAQFLRLTPLTGVTAVGEYPLDGDGLVDAADNGGTGGVGRVTLDAAAAAGVLDWDLTGLLVAILGGSGAGQVRLIKAYNTGTRQVTETDRAWSTIPSAGDAYAVLFPAWNRSELLVRVEFEGTIAQTPSATLIPVLFDYPSAPPTSGTDKGQLGVSGVLRAPMPAYAAQLDVENLEVTTRAQQSGYYHGRVRTESIRGAIGAKLRLHATPGTSKKVTLWAAAV